jgi:hypothetical protein
MSDYNKLEEVLYINAAKKTNRNNHTEINGSHVGLQFN